MDVTRTSVETQSGSMRAIEGVPDGTPLGAVIVLHQAGGLSDQIERTVRELAQEGFYAIGPDLFHRKDLPEDFDAAEYFPNGMDDISPWLEGDDEILSDIDDVIASVSSLGIPPTRIGVLGFSYGGRAAFLAARDRSLGGAVTFYGPGIRFKGFEPNPRLPVLLADATELKTPWLGMFGERDPLTTSAELDQIQAWTESSESKATIVRFPEAGHAFDVDFGPNPPPGCIYLPGVAAEAFHTAYRWLDRNVNAHPGTTAT